MYTYIHVYIYTYIHIYIFSYIHIYNIHMYVYVVLGSKQGIWFMVEGDLPKAHGGYRRKLAPKLPRPKDLAVELEAQPHAQNR